MAVSIEQLNDDDTDMKFDTHQDLIVRQSARFNPKHIIILHIPEPPLKEGHNNGVTYMVDADDLIKAIRKAMR